MEKQITNGLKKQLINICKAYKASSPCSPVLILTASSREKTKIFPSPILSIAASQATGKTVMKGLDELRHKESDRINAIANGLEMSGVSILQKQDQLTVFGKGNQKIKGGSIINASNDHRIAMSFMCLGQVTQKPIEISESSSVGTSFPGFVEKFKEIGANLSIQKNQ